MAKITVTVEGEAQEVREALLNLFGDGLGEKRGAITVSSRGPQSVDEDQQEELPEAPQPWTKDELNRLWAYLTIPARRVLSEVAERPDGYRFEDLGQALGSNMSSIGGNLSSVGHAMRRLYRVGDSYTKQWPLVGDKYKRIYLMDRTVAEMIREIAAENGVDQAE
jgi:hypothetical protein